MKLKRLLVSLISVSLLFLAPGCAKKSIDTTELSQSDSLENGDLTVIGFSQLGAESDWRSANTQSMKETFTEENGYRLIFEDGQQKQANQIMAIRKFIQQDVDYIVLAPVTETGWDTVLREAKDAGIPIIAYDRLLMMTAYMNAGLALTLNLKDLRCAHGYPNTVRKNILILQH